MAFLREAWYCAGFTDELRAPGQMKSITMLGEPVVLFRRADGQAVALADRCPHRFAPLSTGRVDGDAVECGYHGLRFDGGGRCVHNPHGDGAIPKAAQVQAYPVLERHGALWVWMGQASNASTDGLPDFTGVDTGPGVARVQGYLRVKSNYQLVADNLLDLSHVQFLHPLLFNRDVPPPPAFRPVNRVEQDGDTIVAINEMMSCPNTGLYKMLWERGTPPVYVDLRANMRWYPPSLLLLDTGAHPEGTPREDGPTSMQGHWLTPESETSTHYFWCATRDRYIDNADIAEQMRQGIDTAFRTEDEPMVEACQRNMGTSDLMALKPVLLSSDGAAMRARRILAARIEMEGSSPATQV